MLFSFGAAPAFNAGVHGLAVADFNGDGRSDIVASISGTAQIGVSFGNGDMTFRPPVPLATLTAAGGALVADINGDGLPDVIVTGNLVNSAGVASQGATVFVSNGDGTFQSGVSNDLGVGPGPLVSADFNHDGKADLITVAGGVASVSLGNGDGSFKATVNLPTGPIGAQPVTGDFNGDGFADVAFADAPIYNANATVTYPVSTYLGNGDGSFKAPTTTNAFTSTLLFAVGDARPASVQAIDLNGDGRQDLVAVVNQDETVRILTRFIGSAVVIKPEPGFVNVMTANVDGTFATPVTYDAGDAPQSTQTLDANGDGRPDLLIQATGVSTVFLNAGDGAVHKAFPFVAPQGPQFAGDFNGDGRTDLLASNGQILPGNGDGSFNSGSNANLAGFGPTATAMGDFNGDGNLDMVVTNTIDQNFGVFIGNGHGEFLPQVLYSAGTAGLSGQGARGVVVGDFNGDGKLDIAFADEGAPGELGILAGNGDGTFQPATFHGVFGHDAFAIASADFNGDGIPDLLLTDPFTRTVEMIAGGSFGVVGNFAAGQLSQIAVGDFNGDGRPDFMIEGTVYLNAGAFHFTQVGTVNTGFGGDSSIVTGDFNGDGKLDIAVTSMDPGQTQTSPLTVSLGNGDGTFQPGYAVAPPQAVINPQSTGLISFDSAPGTFLAAGDVNGDGIPDLVVNGINDIGVSLGRGDGAFYPQTFFPSVPGEGMALSLADFNNDGHLDIAQIDTGSHNPTITVRGSVDVFMNDGKDHQPQFGAVGFKTSAPAIVTENQPFSVTVTAVDAQGNPVPGFLGTVYLGLDRGSSVAYTFTAADGGTHTFTSTETALTQGAHTVTGIAPFMSAGLVSVSAQPGSFAVTVPSTSVAGVGVPITITALDAMGNPLPTFTGDINISSSDPRTKPTTWVMNASNGGTLTIPSTMFGVNVFPLFIVGNPTISVSSPFMTVASPSVTVTPAAPTEVLFKFTGPVTAGVPFNFTASLYDPYGNFSPGFTANITFTDQINILGVPTDPGAILPSSYTFTLADAGVQTFTATLTTAGSTLLFARSGVTGGGNVQVLPAPAAALRFSTFSTVTAGQGLPFNLTAVDRFGNVATSFTNPIQFTSTDPQAILPGNVSGQSAISNSAIFKTAGTQSITATDVGNPSITTTWSVGVSAAVPSSFVLSTPPVVTAGANQTLTLTVKDAFGNIATGYAGTVHFASSDARNTLPFSYTFTAADAGVHTFVASFVDAGAQSATILDTLNPALTGQSSFTVIPAAAALFTVSGFPATTAGLAQTVTVVARDFWGNVVTNYAGTVSFSSSDAQAGLPAKYTFTASDAGTHSFTATLKTAGSQSLVATDSAAGISGTESGIVVKASNATHFAISAPTTAATGKSFLITVTALDAYGNVAVGYLGKVHLAATVSTSLSSNYAFTAGDNGVHTFSVTLNNAGLQTISALDTVNSQLVGSTSVLVSTLTGGGATGGGGKGA